MNSDANLIETIESVRREAYELIGNQWPPANIKLPNGKDFWDLSKPIIQALSQQTEFNSITDKFFLGRQITFSPSIQCINILRMATVKGTDAAVDWYRRVISIDRTDMRVVGVVFGLFTDSPHTLSNSITIVPPSALPNSPNSSSLKQGIFMGPGAGFPCALIADVHGVKAEDSKEGHQRFLDVAEEMRRTMNAYALADDGSPIVTETWTEFVSPDLEGAEFGRSWQNNRTDGARPSHLVGITPEALSWVEKYLHLQNDVKKACDVSLARLNIANRRISAGDKALDGSICLEAMLSGKSRGELTHKLAVRTALLLGKTLEERQEIVKKVRKFYEIRSAVVHGSKPKNEAEQRAAVAEGIDLCRSALRSIVEHRELPEPENWELTGGPHWNRLS